MNATPPRDEPTKLAEIVVPVLGPEEAQSVTIGGGARAELILGALRQDDCAAYHLQGDQCLVFGSDYIRGSGFRLYEMGLLNNYDIGWYLAGANWSDVAAMGALPLGLLSVIRYPADLSDGDFESLLRGISDCCKSVGALNIGGDIGTAERIILSASAMGTVEPAGLLTRSGADPGDILCLTGPTGLAGSAMKLASSGLHDAFVYFDDLLAKWKRVTPRVSHGRIFSTFGSVTACIDTSDGLRGALEALSASSSVRLEVDRDLLPVDARVAAAAEALGAEELELAFGDSVDFELLCTVRADALYSLRRRCEAAGLQLFPIGTVREGAGAVLHSGSSTSPVPGKAWRHAETPSEAGR